MNNAVAPAIDAQNETCLFKHHRNMNMPPGLPNGQVPPISREHYLRNQAQIAEAQAMLDRAKAVNDIGYATYEAQELELRQKIEAGERAR